MKYNNVLYISRACPKSMYSKLKNKLGYAAVKFNNLMMEGFAENGIQVTASLTSDNYINEHMTLVSENGVDYICTKSLNFFNKIWVNLKIANRYLKKADSFLMCDYLCYLNSFVCLIYSKVMRRKTVCIVTDLPEHIVDYFIKEKHTIKDLIYIKIGYIILGMFDYHVLLTEEMQKKIKCKNYVVIEGIVDTNGANVMNKVIDKKKQVLYAGTLRKVYGIDIAIQAFISLNLPGWVFKIYGDGDYKSEILSIIETQNNIMYCGVADNDVILCEEQESMLLLNPRLTNQEYTKYSFPSKNLEYMSSGTPLLTTKLLGMPEDHKKYVYLFNEESVEGFAKKMSEILALSETELINKGSESKQFVMKNKNKIKQSQRILELISN